MKKNRKIEKDIANQAGALAGNVMSSNMQDGTNAMVEGMELFRDKAASISKVDYDKAKGNLFEYIEAAKFNRKAAVAGSNVKAVITDAIGNPHDGADILLQKNGQTVKKVQAKFNNKVENSVKYQSNEKYYGMQRLIRKGKDESLLNEAKKYAEEKAKSSGVNNQNYRDVYANLKDELTYEKEGIVSDGTTDEEVRKAYNNPIKYANRMEQEQLIREIGTNTANMATACAVSNAIVSGVQNIYDVLQNRKELEQSLIDIGADTAKGAVRGAGTGLISSLIRFGGVKTKIPVLADSTAATVMAGGIIDGGVAIYSYAKGEISADELKQELLDTTVKSTTTIYFTKAVTAVVGTTNPFLPMAIYTVASYVVTSTREIIKNAKINSVEYNRLATLLEESLELTKEYHKQLNMYMQSYEQSQRQLLQGFMDSFEYNMETGENYDQAIYAIISFANQTGIALQHLKFNDFKQAMLSEDDFVL